jgi:hypothetical protein
MEKIENPPSGKNSFYLILLRIFHIPKLHSKQSIGSCFYPTIRSIFSWNPKPAKAFLYSVWATGWME